MAMPRGMRPTGVERRTSRLATSMIDTSLERPLVVNSWLPSGVRASCQTRRPTSRYFRTSKVAVSITATRLAGPRATNAVLPSGARRRPTGWMVSGGTPGTAKRISCTTVRLATSITDTTPPISDVTHSSLSSAVRRA